MAKTKNTQNETNDVKEKPVSDDDELKKIEEQLGKKIPLDVQKKLKDIKEKLESFQKKVVGKFEGYIVGIELLPPQKPEQMQEEGEAAEEQQEKKAPQNPDQINVMVLVDDSSSEKMTKEELKDKLTSIIGTMAGETDKNIVPETILLSELWQSCYDAKYDLLELIAIGAPIYDSGMLAAIKITSMHKNMVLKKFEKYIVSYVLAGSLVQGKATADSDIDVFVVIDDTDVKKMTRAELKDKLRAIIIGMGIEAGEMTGIKNKLNIQIYILTDFWDSIKEANPVIFTFLRDGVPFYDRGIFMPWKQLLKMGKIRPSMEAIEMYMSSGEQMLERVHERIKDIGMEDIFWAILTPSQAAIMLYGLPPPTPKETPNLMRDVFVRKEKLLKDADVDILEDTIKIRKDLEHGTRTKVSGSEVDKLLRNAEEYLKAIKKLFKDIDARKEEESMLHIYETIVTIIRDLLKQEGTERVKDTDIIKIFEAEMVSLGKIPERYLRMLNEIIKAKKDYDEHKLTKTEVERVKKDSREFIKFIIEYMQRKRGRDLERTKIRVKYGDHYGEVLLIGPKAYVIHDIDKQEKDVSKAELNKDGSLGALQPSSMNELEENLSKMEVFPKVFIKQPIFEDLKKIFGRDVEVLVNY